jgi:ketosteroid isomerase-like protein
MSEENVEVVRRAFEAWNANVRQAGDLSREALAEIALGIFDPRVELEWPDGRFMPDLPAYVHGIPAVAGFWEQMFGAYDDLRLTLLECTEAPDDRVFTLTRQSGRGRESGVPIEAHLFQVLTIQEGVISRLQIFRHRADALEAAGLSE